MPAEDEPMGLPTSSSLGKRDRASSIDSDITHVSPTFVSDSEDEGGYTLDLTATDSPQATGESSSGSASRDSGSGTPNSDEGIDSNAYSFLMEAGLDEATLASLGIDLEEIKAQQRLERQAQADLDYARRIQEQLDLEARLEREQRERDRIAADAAAAVALAAQDAQPSSSTATSFSSSSSSSSSSAPLTNTSSSATQQQPRPATARPPLPAIPATNPPASNVNTSAAAPTTAIQPTLGVPQYIIDSIRQIPRPQDIHHQSPSLGNVAPAVNNGRPEKRRRIDGPQVPLNTTNQVPASSPFRRANAAAGSSNQRNGSSSSLPNGDVIDLTSDAMVGSSRQPITIDDVSDSTDYDTEDSLDGMEDFTLGFNPLLNSSMDSLLQQLERERTRALPRTFAGTNIPITPTLNTPILNNKIFYPSEYARPLDAQRTEEELRTLLQNISEDNETLTDADRAAVVPGLGVTLLEHQQIGLKWMTKMETSTNKGGMLLDDMGFGKTIQALAVIVSRPCTDFTPIDQLPMMRKAKQTDPQQPIKSKATLVVCPVSLVAQWAREIITKTRPSLKVCIHHGPNRTHDPTELAAYDVIVTAYTTVASDLPPEDHRRGPLGRIKFHRVILDEAHTIKNRNTQMAAACCRLETTYRWCLTATPIQNRIDELYSLLKFLRVRPYCEWLEFRMHIQKPLMSGYHKTGLKRVQALMKAIALRRSKKAKINGRPIITLPERTVHMTHIDFSPEEREFYDLVDQRAQKRFNKYVAAGTVMKNYSSVLVLLLRLRQACLHPSLTMIETPEIDHEAQAKEKEAIASKMDKTIVDRLVQSNELSEIECPICMDMADQAQINFHCGHIMCRECLGNYLSSNAGAEKRCPQCRGHIDPEKIVPVEIFFKVHAPELYKEFEASADTSKPSKMAGEFISSTKIEKLLEILHETREQTNNQDKTIVFSQFTAFLDLLERPLTQAGFRFVRFDGSMNVAMRDRVLTAFKQDPAVTVLLVSTKCGSLGLNLTEANRVVMMDIWWNPALENQAIDRVHRIGQTKDVIVHRIFINNTVEDRILELQNKKQALADGALGEAGSLQLGRLGLNELLHLFRGTGLD